jgi:hypothetical protein
MQRFPYGLIYEPTSVEIIIIAVAHLHQEPMYWRMRQNLIFREHSQAVFHGQLAFRAKGAACAPRALDRLVVEKRGQA